LNEISARRVRAMLDLVHVDLLSYRELFPHPGMIPGGLLSRILPGELPDCYRI